MRQFACAVVLIATFGISGYAAGKGPDIQVVNNKLSVRAQAVPLGWLLHMLDEATGMTSKVPAALANRNISVQFSDLALNAAVRKIFEGQRLDYFLIGGKGIVVTAASQTGAAPEQAGSPPLYMNDQSLNPGDSINETFIPPQGPIPIPPQPGFNGGPFQPGVPGNPFNQQQQPAVIQTPFGPIPNPRANPAGQQNNDSNPFAAPGQQNPFGSPAQFGSPNPFGSNPGAANPVFGPSGTPFGSGNSNGPNLFPGNQPR